MEFEKKSFLDLPGLKTYDSKIKEHIKNLDNVKYTEQKLTEEQQMQTRKNLGLYYTEDEKILCHKFENVTQTDQSFSDIIKEWFLEEGKTYIVRTEDENGNIIEEMAWNCKVTQFQGWNVYYLATIAMGSGCPYTNISQWYSNDGTLKTTVDPGNHVRPCIVTVYKLSEVVVPIDEKFLPESISRNSVEYTEQELTEEQKMQARKNLDLYREDDERVLWHTFENISADTSFTIDNIFLEEGKTYTVSVEGASGAIEENVFTCGIFNFNGQEVYYVGAIAMSSASRYTGVSQYYGPNSTTKYVKLAQGYTDLPCTVTVYEGAKTIVPVEEKFIPDSIKNDISSVKNDITDIKDDISGINTDVDTIKNDIVDIKNDISDSKKVVEYIEQELTTQQQMQARKNLGLYYTERVKLFTLDNVGASGYFEPTEAFVPLEKDKSYIIRAEGLSGAVEETEWVCSTFTMPPPSYATGWQIGPNMMQSGTSDIGVCHTGTSATTKYYVNIGTNTDVPYTITVYEAENNVIVPIEEEFIPDSIKNDIANLKTDVDDIKNDSSKNAVEYIEQELTKDQQMQARKNLGLHYEYQENVFCHEFEFSDSSSQTSQDTIEWFLEEGKTYIIQTEDANGNVIEEMVYECKMTQFQGWDVYYLGVPAMANAYPYSNVSQWYNNGVLYTNARTGNNAYPCTVIVYELGDDIFVPIEEQYIPDTIARVVDIPAVTQQIPSDWEQNDKTATDYIKNRTHYIDVGTVTPYESYEIDCTEAPQSSLGTSYQNGIGYVSSEKFKINYVENKEYAITFDNTVYNCTATKTYLNQSAHVILIGNGALLTSFCKDNGMPFCFAYRAISDGIWYTAVSTQEVHTVTISYEDDIIVQLDEKYIPDTIQRANNAVGRLGEGQESEIFNDYTSNTATGICAHAEGHYTIASGKNQHVQGRFNIEDTNNTYAHIVGNGQAPFEEMRSNAHTLDWDGNGWYAGNLYVGGTSQADATRVATIADITNNFYPIGAIYLSTIETSPASLFGGTWEQIKDTFLLAAGDIYAAGTVGGSATHTLSIDELATHSHGVKTDINSSEFNIEWPPYAEYTYGWTQDAETTIAPASQTTQTGKSQPFSIMPPYLAIYVWKRIA